MMLPTLAYWKIQGDAITTFNAFSNVGLPICVLFSTFVNLRTRGHLFKLKKENLRTKLSSYQTEFSTPGFQLIYRVLQISFDTFQTAQFIV